MLIELPSKRHTPWIQGLLACLETIQNHEWAQVKVVDLPEIRNVPRWNQGAILRVDGHYVYLDTWDCDIPTSRVDPTQPFGNIELFIKIQANDKWTAHCGVPVTTWTMFHTAQMDWLANLDRRREDRRLNAPLRREQGLPWGFTGRKWGERGPWLAALREAGKGHLEVWDGRARLGDTEEWVLKTHKWNAGIVICGKHGRQTEGKNRREVEFASLGIPMILNYYPTYPDPLISGKHYAFWCRPGNLTETLYYATQNAELLASNAREWWDHNASPRGLCESFIRITKCLSAR